MSRRLLKAHVFFWGLLAASSALAHTFSGEIEVVVVDDFKHKKSSITYTLHEANKRYELLIPKQLINEALSTGNNVIIEGDIIPSVKENQIKVQSISIKNSLKKESVVSERKVLALLVDFNDRKTSTTTTAADIDQSMYQDPMSVRKFYLQSSYSQIKFVREVDTDGQPKAYIINLNYDQGNGCDYQKWADDAKAAAIQAGIDFYAYQHRMFILPAGTQCPWSGRGHLNCTNLSFCESWIITGYNYKSVMSHELGHNLGMAHSSTDPDNNGTVDSEYGDTACVMGNGYSQINAPQRDRMQWFNANPVRIKTITKSKDYLIKSLDTTSKTLKVLKINRDDGKVYYISFRTNKAPFGVPPLYSDKVSIHSLSTEISRNIRSLFITALGATQTFVDAQNNITITVKQIDKSGAVVNVNFNPT